MANLLSAFAPSELAQFYLHGAPDFSLCDSYYKVADAVAETWPGCVVTPYLMVQCSDSRHYRDISNHVYKFSAMDLTAEERKSIHGNNERIRLETIGKAVEFYLRLLGKC